VVSQAVMLHCQIRVQTVGGDLYGKCGTLLWALSYMQMHEGTSSSIMLEFCSVNYMCHQVVWPMQYSLPIFYDPFAVKYLVCADMLCIVT
jgi:hypothetical protein